MKWWEILKYDEELYNDIYWHESRNITLDKIDQLRSMGKHEMGDALEEVFDLEKIRIKWLPSAGKLFGGNPQSVGNVEDPRVRPPRGDEREELERRGMPVGQNVEVIDERDVVTYRDESEIDETEYFSIHHVTGDPSSIGNTIFHGALHVLSNKFYNSISRNNLTPAQFIQTIVDLKGDEEE